MACLNDSYAGVPKKRLFDMEVNGCAVRHVFKPVMCRWAVLPQL